MKIHMTAIGGTGMGAVAGLLVAAGHEVRGSDGPIYPPISTLLAELGVKIYQGYAPENLDWDPDLVVLGNTCKKDHVEYVAAQARKLDIVSFPQLLAQQFLCDRHNIVISGTHGKTTTTSLVAQVLSAAGTDPGFFVGGIPANFGRGFSLGKPPYFVLEGDEYDTACFDKRPKFLHYMAKTVVLTGVEFDHADIYTDLNAVKQAFSQLIAQIPEDGRIIVSAHCDLALELCRAARCVVEPYGVHATGAANSFAHDTAWLGTYEPIENRGFRLTVTHNGAPVSVFDVPLFGQHNMQNALAAIAVAHGSGIAPDAIANGLSTFAGVARRQQVRGVVNGVTVIDDFAHHPTAVKETLLALRNIHGTGRLIAIWEPRSSTSRRAVFQNDWPPALATADIALIAPLFEPHKIPESERLDINAVVQAIEGNQTSKEQQTEAAVLEIDQIVDHVAQISRPGDTIVVMSSGGFNGIIPRILTALNAQ